MRAAHTKLFVADPPASKSFHVGVLGGEVVAVRAGRFVWMKLGEMELLLRPGSPGPHATTYAEARTGIVLYTDDLPAKAAESRTGPTTA